MVKKNFFWSKLIIGNFTFRFFTFQFAYPKTQIRVRTILRYIYNFMNLMSKNKNQADMFKKMNIFLSGFTLISLNPLSASSFYNPNIHIKSTWSFF